MQNNSSSDSAQENIPLNVVVAYQDAPAGKRVMHALPRFSGIEWKPQLWRFDILEDPDWRVLATRDAIEADILIIATNKETEFPETVESWVMECVEQKRGTNGAIVALSAMRTDGLNQSLQQIRRAAIDAGLDFYASPSTP